jgi:hypothetical protein
MPRDILSSFDRWRRISITTLNCINEGLRASLGPNQEKADYDDASGRVARKSRTGAYRKAFSGFNEGEKSLLDGIVLEQPSKR